MPLKVNLAHHPLDALCVEVELGHVFPQDPAGYVLRRGRGSQVGEGGDRRWNLLSRTLGAMASILAIPLQALFHAYAGMPAVGDGDDTHD
jgi:hypothetical protein